MPVYLLTFSCAVLSSAFWPCLELSCLLGMRGAFVVPLLVTVCCWVGVRIGGCKQYSIVTLLTVFVCGIAWAWIWGYWHKTQQLPLALDKTDYYVSGIVKGIPQTNSLRTRFLFELETLSLVSANAINDQDATGLKLEDLKLESLKLGDLKPSALKLRRLLLSSYGREKLSPGQRWQFKVRLRTPRGFSNPQGFDYGAWLFHQGISASGYIRSDPFNKPLAFQNHYPIDQFRRTVLHQIEKLEFNALSKGLLAALTVGDKQGLDSDAWMQLRETSTIHLVIVSGLHIGMVAGLGIFLGNFLGRCLSAGGAPFARQQVGVVLGGTLALLYAVLAGFSLSTQRAVIMLLVFLLASLLKRKLGPAATFLWALAVVALFDPLAALSPGFYLSFGAVAAFLCWFTPRPRPNYLKGLVSAQMVIFLPMSGLLAFFQNSLFLLSPLVNFVAIPWVGLAVVPLALLGMLLLPVSENLADFVWGLAAWQLEGFGHAMDWLSDTTRAFSWGLPGQYSGWVGAAILVSAGIMFMPRGLGLRYLAMVLLLAVILLGQYPTENKAPFTLAVLDVGQGLSVVATTPEGAVIYDAGPKYSDAFNAGSGIIAPYLHSIGVSRVDTLLVSHSDADHSGGVLGLLSELSPERILAGQPSLLPVPGGEPCFFGQVWQSHNVDYAVLHPLPKRPNGGVEADSTIAMSQLSSSDNDKSCVLLIRYQGKTILLMGDVSAKVEQQLLNRGVLPRHLDILVAPHHGSKTSSSAKFVDYVSPKHVVYSSGFNHHFGHPHAVVKERYEKVGAQAWGTGNAGAVVFTWDEQNRLSVTTQRSLKQAYWQAY